MRTFLYIVWFLFPLGFYTIALWSFLEKVSDKHKREDIGDYFRQGSFVLGCVLISIGIDRYLLEAIVVPIIGEWLPLPMLQILLFPVVVLLAARIFGGSKPVLISKAPTLGKKASKPGGKK